MSVQKRDEDMWAPGSPVNKVPNYERRNSISPGITRNQCGDLY